MNAIAMRYKTFLGGRIYNLLKIFGSARAMAMMLTLAGAASVIATYYTITNNATPFGPDLQNVLALIILDLIIVLALAAIISKRLVRMVVERRRGVAGSRLQTRITVIFSLVAIIPTIIMAIFSLLFFNYGIQSWFDKKVSTAIEGSVNVARLYLEEHKKIIQADILGMAGDLNRDAYNIRKNPHSFSQKVAILAGIRKLPEAIVFQSNIGTKNILARTNLSFSLELILNGLSQDVINRATRGELITLTSNKDDRVIALIKLENFFDTYLLVGRFVDNNIVDHIELTEGAAAEYKKLRTQVSHMQVKFFIVFIIVALLLLLVVVWLGLIFAANLVRPLSSLIHATEKVKKGDFSVHVREGPQNDEIATLGRAFNRMTEQLERQRKELVAAQRRSAWSDVARRIAHEIKNPLTPIQLASERLKRKFSEQVEDKSNFTKYIDTIIRNVNDIGNMVEEFSRFARMPAPVFAYYDIKKILKDVIFSREYTNSDIQFSLNLPEDNLILNCDESQLTRVFTNLLKNSAEAIIENKVDKGKISIRVVKEDRQCVVNINDNGGGFPENIIEHLTEPYVTTKDKGTGLGLAIVKKIIEDHRGEIEFKNKNNGALVVITLPLENND